MKINRERYQLPSHQLTMLGEVQSMRVFRGWGGSYQHSDACAELSKYCKRHYYFQKIALNNC